MFLSSLGTLLMIKLFPGKNDKASWDEIFFGPGILLKENPFKRRKRKHFTLRQFL